MKIQDDILHIHDVKLYGCNGDTFEDYEEIAGCPYLYRLKIEGKEQISDSYPLKYGRMFHQILWAMEKEDLGPDEAMAKYYDPATGKEGWDEADIDLQRWLKRSEPNFSTIDAEVFLKIPLFEYEGRTIWYGGTLDRVEFMPDDLSKIFFRDFKTDRSPRSKTALSRDIQFTAYDVLLDENIEQFCHFTGHNPSSTHIVGILDMIKFYTLYTSRSRTQRERFKGWISSIAMQILEDKKGSPRLNKSCGYCHIRYECPEFKKAVKNGEGFLVDFKKAVNLGDRVKTMHKMVEMVSLMNKIILQVKEEILMNPGTYDGVVYSKEKKYKKYIDMLKLHQITGDKFYRVVDISMKKLGEYLGDYPDNEELVRSITTEVFDGWTLSKKRKE